MEAAAGVEVAAVVAAEEGVAAMAAARQQVKAGTVELPPPEQAATVPIARQCSHYAVIWFHSESIELFKQI